MSDQKSPPQRTVRCPQCGQPALFAPSNTSRPFCTERCRLIDLGQWASETYRVPIENSAGNPFLNEDSWEHENSN